MRGMVEVKLADVRILYGDGTAGVIITGIILEDADLSEYEGETISGISIKNMDNPDNPTFNPFRNASITIPSSGSIDIRAEIINS